MDISIVVPFHNGQEHIERCVTALVSQDYPRDRYEIVMVDNNSTDRSAEIVRGHSEVRLLSQSKPGAYAARNLGVASTTGGIIAFTDADCSPDPDWLAVIRRALTVDGVMLVQGRPRFASDSGSLSALADYEAAKAKYTFSCADTRIYYGYTNNMAVRREAFARAGPFLEWRRGADVIFVHRVVEAYSPAAVAYDPAMQIRHWEIANVGAWLTKMRTYGRSIRAYGDVSGSRPLALGDRWRVLRSMLRDNQYSVGQMLRLVALLLLGMSVYEFWRLVPLIASTEASSSDGADAGR